MSVTPADAARGGHVEGDSPHPAGAGGRRSPWVFIKGGCSRRGMQWIGVVLYSKIVYNTVQITTPCFHSTPLCRM